MILGRQSISFGSGTGVGHVELVNAENNVAD
jgi:hypothetical protein